VLVKGVRNNDWENELSRVLPYPIMRSHKTKTFSPRILLVFLLVLSSFSCDKGAALVRDEDELRTVILKAKWGNQTVDSWTFESGKTVFTFSDGNTIRLSNDRTSVFTLNENGFWELGKEKSSITVDEVSKEEMVKTLCSNNGKAILNIVEGYTDWTFIFHAGEYITLLKSLFIYDPDLVVRGVNHRGYNTIAPENTLPAFRLSRLKGFKHVETDVRFTLDGIPVLLHDKTIDRTSTGSGNVGDYSYEQIRMLDFGGWKSINYKDTVIPTLDEFLSLCSKIGLEPDIELKEGSQKQIEEIVRKVDDYGLKGKATYISFSTTLLKYVLEADPTARVGFLSSVISESVINSALSLRLESNEVFVGASDYSESAIALCKEANLPLNVWVVNSENAILALPSYVSGVTSDKYHAGRIVYESQHGRKDESVIGIAHNMI